MYKLINENRDAILNSIQIDHVKTYLDLIIKPNPQDGNYRRRYNGFWKLRGMTRKEQDAYFLIFQNCLQSNRTPLNLADKNLELYKHKLYFSFATKLAHMVNSNLPVYDSRVVAFYFFEEPPKKKNETQEELAIRLSKLMVFYRFLQTEYRRIQDQRLLDKAIEAFRTRFESIDNFTKTFSNVKVIDSLIWAYVKWLNSGAIVQKQVVYHK